MSDIEWTDRVWNPVVGCSRVSAGCQHCYAERVAHRGMSPQHRGLTVMGAHGPRWTGEVRMLAERLGEPLRWRKPAKVFVNSMSDLFHEGVSFEFIAAVFGVMAAASQHTFQVLTKRPKRMQEFFAWVTGRRGAEPYVYVEGSVVVHAAEQIMGTELRRAPSWPLPNVWLGVSVEDQATANERIPLLLECPAAVRWVSYEPALGPVDFTRLTWGNGDFCNALVRDSYRGGLDSERLDWIVVGGESGPGARPFDVAWARSVVEQCKSAEVPCFVKQLGPRPLVQHPMEPGALLEVPLVDRKGGDMAEWPEDLRVRQWPGAVR